MDATAGLPYVDEHAVRIAAPREAVWAAVERTVAALVRDGDGPSRSFRRALGTEPPAGFAIADRSPAERMVLAGRHRFARYALVLELADAPEGATQLRAQTYAAFSGLHGGVYRALVISSRAHVLATTAMLRSVRSRSLSGVAAGAGAD